MTSKIQLQLKQWIHDNCANLLESSLKNDTTTTHYKTQTEQRKQQPATNPLQESRCGARCFASLLKQLIVFRNEFHNNIIRQTLISENPKTWCGPVYNADNSRNQHITLQLQLVYKNGTNTLLYKNTINIQQYNLKLIPFQIRDSIHHSVWVHWCTWLFGQAY